MQPGRERILILEDQEILRLELQDTLVDELYEVEAVESARDAITMVEFSSFDLLLTDVRLGGAMDGIAAVEEIKKRRPSIYTIVLTGYADDLVPSRAMRQGVDFYLLKETVTEQPQRLLNAVRMVLDTQKYHTTYQGRLSQIFRGARRFLYALKGEVLRQEETLDAIRYRLFKSIYIGIQSGNLVQQTVLTLWDRLMPLELEYERLMQVAGPEADALGSRYFLVQQEAEEWARTRKWTAASPRQAGEIGLSQVSVFYQGVAQGKVELARFIGAPMLWQGGPKGDQETWSLLFG